MKSLFKLSLFVLVAIMTTFVACSKSENGLQPETAAVKSAETVQTLSGKSVQIFRLDGVDVGEGTFALDDPNIPIVLVRESSTLLVVNGFTSKERSLEFGDDNGVDLRKLKELEDHFSAYAVSSGAVAEQEATGQIPKWWDAYVENYINTHVRSTQLQTRSVTTTLYRDFGGNGRSTTMVPKFRGASAVLWLWGMNDNISSFVMSQLIFKSVEIAYDRTWFRDPMFVYVNKVWGPGNFKEDFTGAASIFNDRASSWVSQ